MTQQHSNEASSTGEESAPRQDQGQAERVKFPWEHQRDPSPRAFSIGTGYVFQTIGFVLVIGTCCLWSLSSHLIELTVLPVTDWVDRLFLGNITGTIAAVDVVCSFLGGRALIAAGLGLQTEKSASGVPAMIIAGLLALVFLGSTVLLVAFERAWLPAIVTGALGIIHILLAALAGHSVSILRRFPPPPDQNIVSDEWIDAYTEERRRTRTIYPSADRWDEGKH